MKIDGAIFDMDGTLIDSMHLWDSRGKLLLESLGITPDPDVDAIVCNMSLAESSAYMIERYNLPYTVDEVRAMINGCVEIGYREVEPKPRAVEFLEFMKSRGVKMRVASATDKRLVTGVLERLDLMRFFEGVLTCGEVGTGKRSPLIFEESLKLLGTPKESTLVFEDAPYAAMTAMNAGFPLVCVADTSAAALAGADEMRKICRWYIDGYTDIMRGGRLYEEIFGAARRKLSDDDMEP